MRFGEIDIPERVITAQKNGSLVVFAGAGVSMPPPSSYPNFDMLVDDIAASRLRRERIGAPDQEPADHFLGRLERSGLEVHRLTRERLSQAASKPNNLHYNLIKLFPGAAGVHLVTTNFDEHLTTAGASTFRDTFKDECEIYYAPALPLGREFNGIVYLHGCVAKPEDRMVLTDGDYGRAYLTDGWATAFLRPLFANEKCTVLFVGYSFRDPVVPYLARGLSPDGECRRFAFVERGDEERWRFLNIEPIAYPAENDHVALQEALAKWVGHATRGALDHDARVRAIVSKPPIMSPEDADCILSTIGGTDSIQFFVRHARTLDWLKWTDDNGILDPLFAIDVPADNRVSQLANWLANNFACQHCEEVLALIQRKHQKINSALWQEIAQCIAYGPNRPNARVLARWISVLLATTAQVSDHGLLNHMMMKCRYPEDIPSALVLFDHLSEPRSVLHGLISLFDDSEDRRLVGLDVEFVGDAHWLWKAWESMFLPHLDEFADRLEPILTCHIQQAHLLYLFDGGEDLALFRLRLTRPSIRSKPLLHRKGVDVLIDAARDLVGWMAKNKPYRAASVIDAWADTTIPLLQRLALYGLTEIESWRSDDKVQWVLDRHVLDWAGVETELLELLTHAYPGAPTSLQEAFLEAACADIDGTADTRPKAQRVHHILVQLATSMPDSQMLAKRIQSLERSYPKLNRAGDIGLERAPLKVTVDELLNTEPGDLVSRVIDDHGTIWHEHKHMLAQAVSADFGWGMRLARSLAEKQAWDTDVWFDIIGVWREAPLRGRQWNGILMFFAENPALYDRFASSVASFLKAVVSRKTHRLPTSHLPLAERVAEQLWVVAESSDTEAVPLESGDWCTSSLNHPCGDIAEFWVWVLARRHSAKASSWQGTPQKYSRLLSMILDGASQGSSAGKVRLAGMFHFLYTVDKDWTRDKMLPLFDWRRNEDHVEQAWQGFAMWGRLNLEIAVCLQDLYRTTFAHVKALGLSRDNFAADVAEISVLYMDNPLDKKWLADFMRQVESEDRERWTEYVGQILSSLKPGSQERIWSRWLKNYWQQRIDGILPKLEPKETELMIWWSIYLSPVFAEVVEMICKVDAPPSMQSFAYSGLLEKGSASTNPAPTAKLILHMLRTTQQPFWYRDDAVKLAHDLAATDASRPVLKKICDKLCELGVRAEDLPELS